MNLRLLQFVPAQYTHPAALALIWRVPGRFGHSENNGHGGTVAVNCGFEV